MGSGKTWDEVIEEELDAAKCVVVVWSKISIKSRWVRAEAEEGLHRNILVPVSIEDVKIPLLFRPIQSVRLIHWEGDSNHPQFVKFISDLSPSLGPSPLKIKEAEQQRAEEEKRRKEQEEQERKTAEEKRRKEQDLKRKAERKQKETEAKRRADEEQQRKEQEERKLKSEEEDRKKKEAEAKHNADEEQKRRVVKEKKEPDKPEPAKIKPSEPKRVSAATTESGPSEPVSPKPRKTNNAMKLGILAGVAVLLLVGIWWYFSEIQTKKQLIAEQTDKPKPPVEKPKIKTPEPPSPQKVITNTMGMKFVLIPAGSFTMGSQLSPEEVAKRYGGEAEWFKDEQPQHSVNITKPFYLQTTEVSRGQWKEVMGDNMDNPSRFKDCGDDCPVESVSWDDAQKFIKKLNKRERTNIYRLPTEAQWEYACRAETTTPFFTGDCISTDQANYNGNYPARNCPKGKYRGKTIKVGRFQPNAWGLYDMHGNVWEWVQDWYGDYPSN